MTNATANIMGRFMKERSAKPNNVNIAKLVKLNEDHAKILAHVGASPVTASMVEESVTRLFGDSLRVLAGSEHRVNKETIAFFVARNSHTRPFEDAANMIATSANVYLDNEDSVWVVREIAGNKCLVRTDDDDMDSILAAKKSALLSVASVNSLPDANLIRGTHVSFYDMAATKAKTGMAVSASHVFSPEDNAIVSIQPTTVLATFNADRTPIKEMAGETADRYLDYLRKLFSENSVYFKRVAELLASKAAI